MEKLLLRPEEVAEALSVGRTKVYELMGSGDLRSVRVGGSRRVPADALNDFIAALAAHREGATPSQ